MTELGAHRHKSRQATAPVCEAPLAEIFVNTKVSIVIPTYKEVENIPRILSKIDDLRTKSDLDCEVLFMDDDSRDGSVEAVRQSGFEWAQIVVRTKNPGLSAAVLDGFELAQNPVLVCMDCDLSHPVEKIPALILALSSGQEMVIGSRYVAGGSTDDDWGLFRWLNSRIATFLSRPLTSVRDPMSGFFALRKQDFKKAEDLNPIGYKIALELIVKCSFQNIGEVPIEFLDRVAGESKLTISQQLKFIKHLRRLYIHKFAESMYLIQFLVVGASGLLVNLATLTLFQVLGAKAVVSIAAGISVSMCSNFLLNRRFSFSYARDSNILRQFLSFILASMIGAAVNYAVALYLQSSVFLSDSSYSLQVSAIFGVAAGTGFNFIANRFFVFRKRFIRVPK
ncbi:glycosyltransferase family 2 protein [Ruegeria sp. HKCCD4318-2]|uniref:glycosyltransferase n=1 Tax=Ruegeria sp. HKCCD4318-2 TaxID=2683020 RepID=UPI00149243C3|nr:glycosyltransferase family 2 protein [Ruegeria sp. HKCCD4318-2]